MAVTLNPGGTFPSNPNNPGQFNQNPVRTPGFGARIFNQGSPRGEFRPGTEPPPGSQGGPTPGPTQNQTPAPGPTQTQSGNFPVGQYAWNAATMGSNPWKAFNYSIGNPNYNFMLPTFDPNTVLPGFWSDQGHNWTGSAADWDAARKAFNPAWFTDPKSPYYVPYMPTNFFSGNYDPKVWNPVGNPGMQERAMLAAGKNITGPGGSPLTAQLNPTPGPGPNDLSGNTTGATVFGNGQPTFLNNPNLNNQVSSGQFGFGQGQGNPFMFGGGIPAWLQQFLMSMMSNQQQMF